MHVVCLIADIVASRDIPDRGRLQADLESAFVSINETSKATLLSPYTITLGDEFQAVYRDFSSVFGDIARILWVAYPYRIRFSLCRGPLSTRINPERALGMDGPAFHGARTQLEDLKKRGRSVIAIREEGGADNGGADTELINAGLSLFANEAARWNRTALGCFVGLMRGDKVSAIGKEVGVKERMVYKSISQNGIKDCIGFLETVANALGKPSS